MDPLALAQQQGFTPVQAPDGRTYYVKDNQVYYFNTFKNTFDPASVSPTDVGITGAAGGVTAQSAANTQSTFAQQEIDLLATLGIDPNAEGGVQSADTILGAWAQTGIDTSNPDVISAAELAGQAPDVQTQADLLTQVQAKFTNDPAYHVVSGSYEAVKQGLGLGDVSFSQPPPIDTQNTGTSLMHGAAAQLYQPAPPPSKEYQYVNGVYYFANGVIANPTDGSVIYDPSQPNVPGSEQWVTNATHSWGAEKTANWRAELFKLGYIDSKKGGWDNTLVAATKNFYAAKYVNGGQVIANGPPGGGTGATRTPPKDLHKLTPLIQNSVQQQYQSVFGQDPTPAELHSWTQFIINAGMQLQRGNPDQALTADSALQVATAKASRQIYNSPEAQTWMGNQQENTRLHDALTSAISAVRGL